MSIIDVSVIIVNWNTKDILRNCLKSIYDEGGDVALEVIVIDNASTDGSVEMVKKDFSQAVLIENSENRGFAAANNQGIAIAKGRYVLLLNSDTIVLDKALEKTISFADSHPESAVVGCRALNPDRTLQPTCFMFPCEAKNAATNVVCAGSNGAKKPARNLPLTVIPHFGQVYSVTTTSFLHEGHPGIFNVFIFSPSCFHREV